MAEPRIENGDESASQGPLTLGDLVAILWRRRVAAALAGILVAGTVLLGTFRMTPTYEAAASLAMDRGRKAVDFDDQSQAMATGREYSFLNTQRDILLSRTVLARTLERSGLIAHGPYAAAGDPVEVLESRLSVSTSRDSWVLRVALRDEQPDRAQHGLDVLLAVFLEQQQDLQSKRSTGALGFLSEQVATARERLEEARRREHEFRREKAIVSTNADDNPYQQRLDLLTQERARLDERLAASRALMAEVEAAAARTGMGERTDALMRIDRINRHEVVLEQQKLLYDLLDRRVLLAQKYLEKHPRMLEIEEQIAAKREHLHEAVLTAKAAIQTEHQELLLRASDLEDRSRQLTEDLQQYRSDIVALQALEEERENRKRLFETLLARLSEEEVASRLDARQVVMVDPPQAGPDPVNIKPLLFLAAAVFAGGVAAVLMALLAETLDRRVRGQSAAQEITGQPLLGQVPQVPGLKQLGADGDPEKPFALAEAYRAIRAAVRLTRKRGQNGCLVLAITSSGPGEGKSTVSCRLSIALASTGARCLLIDGDLRKPTLHHQLAIDDERGFSYLLAGEQDVTPLVTRFDHLDFLPVGVLPPNPSELLHAEHLGGVMARWRQEYDYVVIDTPPLGVVADALTMADHIDALALVVRDRVTNKRLLRRVMQTLSPVRELLVGIVLNGERREGASYGGYSYYKYGAKYGHTPEKERAAG